TFRLMLHWLSSRGIARPVGIAIIVLGVIQLTLQIWALVDIIKRPAPAQRKLIFAAVTVLGGLLGAIAYLAVGRPMLAETSSGESVGSSDAAARKRALDQLYGPDHPK